MRNFLPLLFYLLIPFLAFVRPENICGESTSVNKTIEQVSGRVMSYDSIPLSGANVAVVQLPDSVVTEVTLTDERGAYNIAVIKIPSVIKISKRGYLDTSLQINSYSENLDFMLEPEAAELSEFTVKATKATIKAKPGMFVYDPADMAKYIGNARELMEFVPLVSSFSHGDVTIFSKKGNAKIFINGEDPMMANDVIIDKLRNTPSNKIKKIELIMDPGVKYGMEYAACGIINIIMDDDLIGWNATINGSTSFFHRRFDNFAGDGSWFYQNHNLLLSFYPYYNRMDSKDENHNVTLDENSGLLRDVDYSHTQTSNTAGGYLTGEYRFGRNSIGASLGIYSSKSDDNQYYQESEILGGEHKEPIYSHAGTLSPWDYSIDAVARYIHWFDDIKSSSLNAKVIYLSDRPNDVVSFMRESEIPLGMEGYSPVYERDQSYNTHYDYIGLSATFNKSFPNQSSLSVNGTLYDYDYHSRYQDPENAFNFGLNNKVAKVSIEYNRQWCNFFGMSLGLNQGAVIRKIDEKFTSQMYKDNFYPFWPKANFSFSFKGGNHSVNLDYQRMIHEPTGEELNPYRKWLSATEYSEGNPHLKIVMSDNLALRYSMFSQLFISLNYIFGNFNAVPYKMLDEAGNIANTFVQSGREHSLTTNISWTKFFFNYRWRLNASVYMNWDNQFAKIENGRLDNHSVSYYASISNSVRILPRYGFSGSLSYTFKGRQRFLAYQLSDSHKLSLGLEKNLWRNAQLSGNISIPLKGVKTTFLSPGMEQTSINRYANDLSFNLMFTWSFGKFSIERVNLRD